MTNREWLIKQITDEDLMKLFIKESMRQHSQEYANGDEETHIQKFYILPNNIEFINWTDACNYFTNWLNEINY